VVAAVFAEQSHCHVAQSFSHDNILSAEIQAKGEFRNGREAKSLSYNTLSGGIQGSGNSGNGREARALCKPGTPFCDFHKIAQ